MKKYSDKHLESVPAEFIVGCEISVERLLDVTKTSSYKESYATCPGDIVWIYDHEEQWGHSCSLCSSFMKYNRWKSDSEYDNPCPCYCFGEKEAIKKMKNLISQWRKWAGLRNGE